ncbi:MAG: 50S ribosomal protein L28 [Flavobacteriaceae bacterium]|jgi:large subunit ribosomal protein L28|nr:50S ribosomal protein L28 [Flavobacteriaceae bacterium]|tara:strand:+ start:5365 stop:5601 length:237 start_codon:yes stop_codon:yes gene_type:complete
MSKICQITGKRVMFGNNVSKSINKTRRRFDLNLIKKRFFIPNENKWITLKIKASVLRTINKKGISAVIKEARLQGILK